MENKTKVIILGNTGFIGGAVYNQFKESGNADVYGYSSSSLDLTKRDELKKLDPVIDENTVVIMASAITKDKGESENTLKKNLEMLNNLAMYLKDKKIKKLIYLSSVAVYGEIESEGAITEETMTKPDSFYAKAKYESELIATKTASEGNFSLLILRQTNVYGPGDPHITYGPMQFVTSIVNDGKIDLYGKGDDKRDFIYIKDLARIICELSLKDAEGLYNIATGESHSFEEVAKILESISGEKITIQYKPRKQKLSKHDFDISKLINTLPGSKFTSLDSGLKETYKYYTRQ